MPSFVLMSPAKLNLLLAVTGRRPDSFHSLVSVVAPLAWGDELRVESAGGTETGLCCDDPAVPAGKANLILRADACFRERSGWRGGARIFLAKRIPVNAGLGGGSSNAVAALRGLNRLAAETGHALSAAALHEIAAELGSDCPLFLADGPLVMRGRGETILPLAAERVASWRGRRLLVFRPAFGVATDWAYRALAAQPEEYVPPAVAEEKLAAWLAEGAPLDGDHLFNTLEIPVFRKYPALPAIRDCLRERHGLRVHMSGSGSACFACLPDGVAAADVAETLRAELGPTLWWIESTLSLGGGETEEKRVLTR